MRLRIARQTQKVHSVVNMKDPMQLRKRGRERERENDVRVALPGAASQFGFFMRGGRTFSRSVRRISVNKASILRISDRHDRPQEEKDSISSREYRLVDVPERDSTRAAQQQQQQQQQSSTQSSIYFPACERIYELRSRARSESTRACGYSGSFFSALPPP